MNFLDLTDAPQVGSLTVCLTEHNLPTGSVQWYNSLAVKQTPPHGVTFAPRGGEIDLGNSVMHRQLFVSGKSFNC